MRTLAIALLLAIPANAARAEEPRGESRSLERLTPDAWSTADTVRGDDGRVREKITHLDTTGEQSIKDGARKTRRQTMRGDGTPRRETISYAEQGRGTASMSKTIAWRRRDGSVRFAVGIGVGFGGRLPLKLHVKTPFGTFGKLPARAVPRDGAKGRRGRAPKLRGR